MSSSFEVLGEKGDDLIAAGQLALHFALDGQAGLLAVEFENLVDGVEEFLGLAGRDLDFVVFFWTRSCGGGMRLVVPAR